MNLMHTTVCGQYRRLLAHDNYATKEADEQHGKGEKYSNGNGNNR